MLALTLGLALFASYFEMTDLLIFFVGSYFVLHLYFDDLALRSENSPEQNSIFEFLAFFTAFTSTTIVSSFHAPRDVMIGGLGLSLLIVVFILTKTLMGFHKISRTGTLMLFWTFLAGIAFYADADFLLLNLWGLIVPYHYFHWYYGYYRKLKKQNRPPLPYFKETLFFLLPHLALGGLYYFEAPHFNFLKFLYRLDYFSIWTLTHLLFTNRPEDWKKLNFLKRTSKV